MSMKKCLFTVLFFAASPLYAKISAQQLDEIIEKAVHQRMEEEASKAEKLIEDTQLEPIEELVHQIDTLQQGIEGVPTEDRLPLIESQTHSNITKN